MVLRMFADRTSDIWLERLHTSYAVTPTSSKMKAPCRKNKLLAYGVNAGLRVVLRAALAAIENAPVEPVPMFNCGHTAKLR